MKQELNTLKKKRKECDLDFERLRKRMHSCENAMKELPNFSLWSFYFTRERETSAFYFIYIEIRASVNYATLIIQMGINTHLPNVS